MKPNKIATIFLICLLSGINSIGQVGKKKIFLDQNLFATDSINASYYKVIEASENDSSKILASTFKNDGSLVSIEQYSNYEKKIKSGKSFTYHSNLKFKTVINFKDGKFHDTLQTFYSDGKLRRLEIYEEGKMISGKCYGTDGQDTLHFPYEKMARYPGGENGMIQYLKKNTIYPKKARKNEIEGTVYVNFVVNKNGEIVKLKVAKSVDPLLDEEALRVVSNMGKWIPGEMDGEKISLYFTLPIKFKLQ